MKKITLTALLLYINFTYCQNNVVYLEVDNFDYIEEVKGNLKGIYEFNLPIINKKNPGISDYYKFMINCDGTKSFEENGGEFLPVDGKILRIDDLKKKSSCGLHEYLSLKQLHLLVKDKTTNKYKRWIFMYLGTSKNTVTMRQKNKI